MPASQSCRRMTTPCCRAAIWATAPSFSLAPPGRSGFLPPLRRILRPMPAQAQYSVTIRVELDARQEPLGKLTAAIAEAGGSLQGVDLVPGAGGEGKRVREFTIDARDQEHWEEILRAIGSTRGARVIDYVDRTLQMHRGGKIAQ